MWLYPSECPVTTFRKPIMVQQAPFGEINVRWNRQTHFTGRNGYLKCNGVQFLPLAHNNSVMLLAINSRGDVARCDVEIPNEAIPELIESLQQLKERNDATASKLSA